MTNEGRTPVMTGGCQCGAVRYALYAAPETTLCHCRMCQKAVAGSFAALAKVKLTDFAWTRGTPGAFRSSSVACRDFCADCGTPLSFRFLDGDAIEVTVGSLDRPHDAVPVKHFGVESRLPWDDTLAHLPTTTTEASQATKPEFQGPLVSFQHPDRDTAHDWRPPRAAD
jgi:hypothetical protein